MKIIKRIVLIIISIFLILLLSYNVYKFICTKILKKDMVPINGYVTLGVVSGSMEPTLQIGDLIIIDTKIKNYKKGDIVTFYDSEGSFVTHRIVSIKNKKMVTKGDNNNAKDDPTNTNKIVGKYVLKIPKGQKVLNALKSPIITILILVNGILVCVFASIDRHGNIILNEEEQEYQEFKEYLGKKKNK